MDKKTDAIREVLAEQPAQQQEPVACVNGCQGFFKHSPPASKPCKGIPRKGCNYLTACDTVCNKCGEVHHHHQMVANFCAPPSSKPWVGLTDEEKLDLISSAKGIGGRICGDAQLLTMLSEHETKLKEKNA